MAVNNDVVGNQCIVVIRVGRGKASPTGNRRCTGTRDESVWVHHLRASILCIYAQRKPSISPCWPIVSQCLQLLEECLIKPIFRATGAVGALLAAHRDSSHASRMYDSRSDGQQHAGPYPSIPFHLPPTTRHSTPGARKRTYLQLPSMLICHYSSPTVFAEKHLLA